MPTYQYVCESCGNEFEQFQTITARPLRVCPACGEQKLNRLIGAGAGIIFKGSGFYQTDYRSDGYKQAKAKEKTPAGGDADKKTNGAKGKTEEKKTKSKDANTTK